MFMHSTFWPSVMPSSSLPTTSNGMALQRFPLFPFGDEQITLQPNKELIKELINPMNSSASLTILVSPSYRQNCGRRKTHQNSHLDFLCYSEIEKLCVPEGIFLQLAKTWSSLFCHRWRNCRFFELIEPNVICMLNRAYEGMEIYEKEKDMRDEEGKRGLRNQRGWKERIESDVWPNEERYWPGAGGVGKRRRRSCTAWPHQALFPLSCCLCLFSPRLAHTEGLEMWVHPQPKISFAWVQPPKNKSRRQFE